MKRVIYSSLESDKPIIYQAIQDAKPKIDKATKALELDLKKLDEIFKSRKTKAYNKYIDKCTDIANSVCLDNEIVDEDSKEYVIKVLVDYASVE